MRKINLAFIMIFCLLTASSVVAQNQPGSPARQPTVDPRLPPVLPGQEVKLNEKKMKVWSTSGSLLSEGQVPEPNAAPGEWTVNKNPKDVSVVIDGRDLVPHHNHQKR